MYYYVNIYFNWIVVIAHSSLLYHGNYSNIHVILVMQLADCNTALAAEREAHERTCAELNAVQRELQDARESASRLEQVEEQLDRMAAEKRSLEDSLEDAQRVASLQTGSLLSYSWPVVLY